MDGPKLCAANVLEPFTLPPTNASIEDSQFLNLQKNGHMPPSRRTQVDSSGPSHPYRGERGNGVRDTNARPDASQCNDGLQDKGNVRVLPSNLEQISRNSYQGSSGAGNNTDSFGNIFKSKVDHCSESEIIADCKALNNRIKNTVLNVAEHWTKVSFRKPRSSDKELRARDRDFLRSILGETLYNSIKRHGQSRSTLTEIEGDITDALQTLAAYISNYIISDTFCPALSNHCDTKNKDIFISMIFHGMSYWFLHSIVRILQPHHPIPKEPQVTALRWRALTYSHATRSTPNRSAPAINAFLSSFQSRMAYDFKLIFLLAGESASSPFLSEVPQILFKCGVIESAVELAEKLKTSIFSTYIDTYWVKPKLVFDESLMDEDGRIGKSDSSHQTLVACTMELGIREIVTDNTATQSRKGRILLKPKVLVEVSDSLLIYSLL
ncbi:uncharacterized protein FOMMEDRAFT_159803 [Fomitiporia mediterranea MF3/22]|uniref:uncharacterized protein n=1 Tax=Fomitiporia mediterranea (strain MF3/22) TaxID=694068 RepID=UPI00044077EC|nr:uncharacterized protein FOMMEDRAFT_159803 [Fomitiporia mediterranea MF3/22]EJD00155.1 hypothetical protein FOMMEDRAFT_159803 [Fomitiporia mediterranea MF3/22]